MTSLRRTVASAFVLLLVAAPAARAEPFQVTGGFLFLGEPFGIDFALSGHDFIYVGEGNGDSRFLESALCCSPQQTRSEYHLTFSSDDVTDFSSNSSCPGCGYSGDLLFRAAAINISEGGQSPFTMSGTLSGFMPGSSSAAFQRTIAGAGRMFAGEGFVRYEFSDTAPVPEPGTLLLTGGALAALARRLKKRRALA
jgi:hypothetical protein